MELISIITPSYNCADFISRTIHSVLQQTYQNWEMIIVDDVSSDNSCAVIEEFCASEPRIKLIKSDKNQGPALTRNTAIKAANGDYIAFLDSDDLWLPSKLEDQLKHMNQHNADLSYTAYQWMNEEDELLPQVVQAAANTSYFRMLNYNKVGCLTAMYNAKRIGKKYFVNTGHEDYILWLSIIKSGHKAVGLNQTLAHYRIRQGSVSKNKIKTAKFQWNIYRNIENLSLPRSAFHFVIYTANGLLKSLK